MTMRILYASERPPYPFFLGGAARCAHQLLYCLSNDLGADCVAVGSSDYAVSPWHFPAPSDHASLGIRSVQEGTEGSLDCGYSIRVFPDFLRSLNRFIDSFRPDIIWAQLEGAREVLTLAKAKEVQGLLYVHDAEFNPAELRATAELGCHVVCSSGFLAAKAAKVIGRPAHVIYPASELYFGTEADDSGEIAMINPFQVKGIDTFWEIAKRLPQQRFLLQESWKLSDKALAALQDKLAQVPNVRFQQRVSDMRQVYGQTRLLLAPSVWEEGFGMVAIEAQSCGIPVIASARGGLPESVGDGGLLIDDYRNVDAWVSAIHAVLDSPANYQTWSRAALAHAQSADFNPNELARRFLAICHEPAPPPCAAIPQEHGLFARLRRLFQIHQA